MEIRWNCFISVVLVVLASSGCTGREPGPRLDEDPAASSQASASLAARVDSLERAVAEVIAQYGQLEPLPLPDDVPEQEASSGHRQPGQDALPAAGPVPLPEEVRYATYRNVRLGYTIDYPANVMLPVEMLGNGNGQRFSTTDGRAVLAVYGLEDAVASVVQDLYRAELNAPDRRVTYQTLHDDGFVISGYVGKNVFYERTTLRDGVLKTFLLLYDAASKDYFEPITEHVSRSFEG